MSSKERQARGRRERGTGIDGDGDRVARRIAVLIGDRVGDRRGSARRRDIGRNSVRKHRHARRRAEGGDGLRIAGRPRRHQAQ